MPAYSFKSLLTQERGLKLEVGHALRCLLVSLLTQERGLKPGDQVDDLKRIRASLLTQERGLKPTGDGPDSPSD